MKKGRITFNVIDKETRIICTEAQKEYSYEEAKERFVKIKNEWRNNPIFTTIFNSRFTYVVSGDFHDFEICLEVI